MKNVYVDSKHGVTISLFLDVGDGPPRSHLITEIQTNEMLGFREQGWASKLLKVVCADADIERVVLLLANEPDGTGLDSETLDAWYKRHGFVSTLPNTEGARAMERWPKQH